MIHSGSRGLGYQVCDDALALFRNVPAKYGIELPDRRIAWSFPGLGVHVAPFIAAGAVDAKGRMFRVRHLYGLRPFADEAAMRSLRSGLYGAQLAGAVIGHYTLSHGAMFPAKRRWPDTIRIGAG